MLEHRLYKSDLTGEVISDRFLHLTYPTHWHYTVLRGLDYLSNTRFRQDSRLSDALEYLESRRSSDGTGPVEKRIPGLSHFDLEPLGKPSRWNTLRALRIRRRTKRGSF